MIRSRAKLILFEDVRLRVGIGVVLGLVVVWIVAPWIRDAVGSILVSSSLYREYALTPHDVLASELRAAKDELSQMQYQSILYQSLMTNYTKLLNESSVRPETSFISARVVAVPPHTVYDTLVVAAGSADGVEIGDRATVEKIVVGTVTSVSARSAVLLLYSSPGTRRDMHLGVPQSIVTGTGVGGGAFEATIPGSIVLKPGDAVTDSESGFLIAIVATVTKPLNNTAASVRMYAPVDVSALSYVSLTHTNQP